MQKAYPVGENRLLQRTNAADLARLQPHLKNFPMELGAVLHVAGASIKHVYFPLSGMVSLLAVMRTGEQIETAIVGREGVVGASIGSAGSQSAGQATVQIAGSAWRIEAPKFLDLYQESIPFRTLANATKSFASMSKRQFRRCPESRRLAARGGVRALRLGGQLQKSADR